MLSITIYETQRRQYEGHNTPLGSHTDQGPCNGQGVYCGLSTAYEEFLIFTTKLYQYSSLYFFLFALFSVEPKVFLPIHSQTAILHAAHFWRVVKYVLFPRIRLACTYWQVTFSPLTHVPLALQRS